MNSPELSVVLVNYNDRVHLGKCLLSLRENLEPLKAEVIVVDNHSSDASREWIKKDFPEVKLLANPENAGYARANNQGIRESRGAYILLLNTDTILFPYAANVLLHEMKNNPQAGAAGPLLLTQGGKCQVSFGRKVDFFSEFFQKYFFNPYFSRKLKNRKKKWEVGWLSGACLLSKKAILEEAGLFDENFFLYFEDIDLCVRIKKKGWKLIFLPQARVFHAGGASTAQNRMLSRYHYRRSQLYFYHKNNSRRSLWLLRLFLRASFLGFFVRGLFNREAARRAKNFFRLLRRP